MLGRGKRSTAQQSDYERRRAYNLYPFVCVFVEQLSSTLNCLLFPPSNAFVLLWRASHCKFPNAHSAENNFCCVCCSSNPLHYVFLLCGHSAFPRLAWSVLEWKAAVMMWKKCERALVCMCVWVCALFACLWRSISSVSFFIVTFCIILFNFLLFFFT